MIVSLEICALFWIWIHCIIRWACKNELAFMQHYLWISQSTKYHTDLELLPLLGGKRCGSYQEDSTNSKLTHLLFFTWSHGMLYRHLRDRLKPWGIHICQCGSPTLQHQNAALDYVLKPKVGFEPMTCWFWDINQATDNIDGQKLIHIQGCHGLGMYKASMVVLSWGQSAFLGSH